MARGDAKGTGPGTDVRDTDMVQVFDGRDGGGVRGDQYDEEIGRRAEQWHGVIDS